MDLSRTEERALGAAGELESRPLPTHGVWCSARIGPATCGSCGEGVLSFSCDCDCRVLLDERDGGLAVHACAPDLNAFSERDVARVDEGRSFAAHVARSPDVLLTSARRLSGVEIRVDVDAVGLARVEGLQDADTTARLVPVALSFIPLP